MIKYFTGSFFFTLAAMFVCYLVAGPMGAFYAAILGVLEISLSMDNAVVNAKVLKDMDPKWQHRFITWGILIAVFGMRVVFPILIVWATSPLSLIQSATLPFTDPTKYADTLSAAHLYIAGFGGAFLLMIFFGFFMDKEKDEHWIAPIEKAIQKITSYSNTLILQALWSVACLAIAFHFIKDAMFFVSGVGGIIAYMVVEGFGSLFENEDATKTAAKAGLAGFLYLELVDASFSFDGVIGAFAVSDNIIIIALGLGIGAMFVRSLTLMLVDKGTLANFKYLEHGAFWSVGTLAACMFAGTVIHIPEYVTGLSAGVIIGLALIHSLISKDEEPGQNQSAA